MSSQKILQNWKFVCKKKKIKICQKIDFFDILTLNLKTSSQKILKTEHFRSFLTFWLKNPVTRPNLVCFQWDNNRNDRVLGRCRRRRRSRRGCRRSRRRRWAAGDSAAAVGCKCSPRRRPRDALRWRSCDVPSAFWLVGSWQMPLRTIPAPLPSAATGTTANIQFKSNYYHQLSLLVITRALFFLPINLQMLTL